MHTRLFSAELLDNARLFFRRHETFTRKKVKYLESRDLETKGEPPTMGIGFV